MFEADSYYPERRCYKDFLRPDCCIGEMDDSFGDCDFKEKPKGPAVGAVLQYGESEENFYKAYLKAWEIATTNGWKLNHLA